MDDKDLKILSIQIEEIKIVVDDLSEILDILHKEITEIKKNVLEINKILDSHDFNKDALNGYMHG